MPYDIRVARQASPGGGLGVNSSTDVKIEANGR
jgi:hypothetical protein